MAKAGPVRKLGLMESCAQGLEEPIPKNPALVMVRAEGLLVAYASVEVPMYRLPPMEENIQVFLLSAALVSVRAKLG